MRGANVITAEIAKGNNLGDVLVENPSLYITLASSAQAYFAQKFPEGDADAVAIGASANPDNFSNWYETNEGIVFLFGEYAIGPYSLGIQEFPFSRKEYKNLFTAAYE